jgi:flagellar motor switch protein FliM
MPSPTATPVAYDFRRPNKFTREHVRALQIASETFARQFTTVLSTTLRTVSQVQAKGIHQLTYDEYIRDVPNPTYLAILSLAPLAGASIFHLPLPVVMTAVDRLLGGPGAGPAIHRPLTEIEQSLVRDLLGRVLRELAYAFESLTALEPAVLHQESNPQFAQIGSPSDMVIVFVYDLRIGGQAGEATLCVPFASLQPVLDEVAANSLLAGRVEADAESVRESLAGRMGAAPVTISVSFPPVTLALSDIVDLRPGDVLPLEHRVDAPLEVSVGGLPRFAARPGRRGKRLACVITSVAAKEIA